MPQEPGKSLHHQSWRSRSEAETEHVGRGLGQELGSDAVLLLHGEMGSGKTVLVRGLAAALGVDPREVQSPTYSLIHEHQGEQGRLVHVDLYRLDPGELEGLGLDELLAGPGVKAVEWAERLGDPPPGASRVEITADAGAERTIVLLRPVD